MISYDYAADSLIKISEQEQENIALDKVYAAICNLPKKVQLNLIERFINDNDLTNDLIDINIAKLRMTEQGSDYEEFRKNRK